MTKLDETQMNTLLLTLIAEIQALAVAFHRLGERMATSNASHEESAFMLMSFFQEQQVAMTTYKIYVDSIRKLEKSSKSASKQIKRVNSLCAKVLFKRYGMTF
jgi:hypothetical protein